MHPMQSLHEKLTAKRSGIVFSLLQPWLFFKLFYLGTFQEGLGNLGSHQQFSASFCYLGHLGSAKGLHDTPGDGPVVMFK